MNNEFIDVGEFNSLTLIHGYNMKKINLTILMVKNILQF